MTTYEGIILAICSAVLALPYVLAFVACLMSINDLIYEEDDRW